MVTSCGHGPVTNAKICYEIPFIDGAEGACVETVTKKKSLVSTQDWVKNRPYMLMIDAKEWVKIKKDWIKACRDLVVGQNKCNIQVQTIDDVIQALNNMTKNLDPLTTK